MKTLSAIALVTVLVSSVFAESAASAPSTSQLIDSYLDRYFLMFPSRATAEGIHDLDRQLEDLSPQRRRSWLKFNRDFRSHLQAGPKPSLDDQLDAELLLRQINLEIYRLSVLRVPERDPLYWTDMIGNATVLLLVRDDLPRDDRISRALDRARQLPRLAAQARESLSSTPPSRISPELCRLAAGQVEATSDFYRQGFPQLRPDDASFRADSEHISETLAGFGTFLEKLATRASGSPRLGKNYAENFRLGTGDTTDVSLLLSQAEDDLNKKRIETATYGRSVWGQFMSGPPPADDRTLLRRLFDRVQQDHAATTGEFLQQFSRFVDEAEKFVREHQVVTLPEPRTLLISQSPPFFIGQSVGGVYEAGPYQPEAQTLLYLPTPSPGETAEQKAAFFRDFNTHFARMITPHEIMPGHYVENKYAALNPHKVRAIFGDTVALEGWGTFSERIMLDLGWGGPLDRLAHLKKQMENIARTILDIRIHTTGISRADVIRFAKEEALQDDQFANNLWTRSITTSPQITSYYLGYHEFWKLYEEFERRHPGLKPKDFTDPVMKLGPVPIYRVRQQLLAR